MKLVDALRQSNVKTENGMTTNSTSLNACVDLFYNIGAMRGQEKARLISLFSSAFVENPDKAMKILFWSRDVRGGAGERQIFRDIISYLAESYPETLKRNLSMIPNYGRWDDLLTLVDTQLEADAFKLISDGLASNDPMLCAKWMPRKGKVAAKLRNYLGLSPKTYRTLLVSLTSVVEQLMCGGKWEDIDFSKIPSLASARYQKAFMKNAKEKYEEYILQLKEGKTKINAGAVYPYDIIKSMWGGNSDVAAEQWKALPNYMEGSTEMILPMVDVSGSMNTPAGGNPNVTCMDVSVSLGLYIAERNEGPFKDSFLTFSEKPAINVLTGNLKDRFTQMSTADWGGNTNIEAAFELVLNQAIKHNVSVDQMPDKILILSDMEFDCATNNRWSDVKWNPTMQEMVEKMYADAGYRVPKIVYWNIQSRNGNVPVSYDKMGTALISGFSPAIMTAVLGAEEFTPESIMNKTIMSSRYSAIKA